MGHQNENIIRVQAILYDSISISFCSWVPPNHHKAKRLVWRGTRTGDLRGSNGDSTKCSLLWVKNKVWKPALINKSGKPHGWHAAVQQALYAWRTVLTLSPTLPHPLQWFPVDCLNSNTTSLWNCPPLKQFGDVFFCLIRPMSKNSPSLTSDTVVLLISLS